MRWYAYIFSVLLWLIILAYPISKALSQEEKTCDVALVLAMDVSASITNTEFELQRDSTAAAIINPAVMEAIQRGPIGCIHVALMQWSNLENQRVSVDWSTISNMDEAVQVAARIANMERAPGNYTGIGAAIKKATELLDRAPPSLRPVIDVSGDGPDNDSYRVGMDALSNEDVLEKSRDAAFEKGITINGLVILENDGKTDLVDYYKNFVKTPNGFVIPANSMESYGEALISKLIQEIS